MDKYLNDEDIKELSFAELAVYIEALNEIEKEEESDNNE